MHRWATAFCRIRAVYCCKSRVSFSISGINRGRKIVSRCRRNLSNYPRKKLGEEKKRKKETLLDAIPVHPIALARKVKIESSGASDRYSICRKRSAANGHVRRCLRISRELDGREKCSYIGNLLPIYPPCALRFSPHSPSLSLIRLTCRRDSILKNSKAMRLQRALDWHYFFASSTMIRIFDFS